MGTRLKLTKSTSILNVTSSASIFNVPVSTSIVVQPNETENIEIGKTLSKILFDYHSKISPVNLTSVSPGNFFIIGTIIFICMMVAAIYLDKSLRNQVFFVFDNCTNEDYNYEYVVKVRFGLSPEFTSFTDLIIEFYNDKLKPLAKFVIVGSYLENGLNIGTSANPGMKITILYLFKHNSLTNLEYCRAYLKTEDSNIVIHLYSIEVGTNKNVHLFLFNHGINRASTNVTDKFVAIEEPVIVKYTGPMQDTSYFQASIFIYSFFLFAFFMCRLYPTRQKITIFSDQFKLDRGLLTNSSLSALISGLLYVIFRDFIHAKYASTNGDLMWWIVEILTISALVVFDLILAFTSILTPYLDGEEEAYYFFLVIYTNLTLLYWIPIGFFYFYIFSPSNYHIGRIIMKRKYHGSEKSRFRKKRRHSKIGLSKTVTINQDEESASEMDNGEKVLDETEYKEYKAARQKQNNTKQVSQLSAPNYFTPAIALHQGTYVPIFDQSMVKNKKLFASQYPFNMPSPVTYINDPQFISQVANRTAVNLPVQQFEIGEQNQNSNLLSPYKSLRGKIPHKDDMSINPLGQIREMLARRSSERASSPLILPKLDIPRNIPKPIARNDSKTSICSSGSTGSDYYNTMFNDGKIPKVGSISQYGSLLRPPKE